MPTAQFPGFSRDLIKFLRQLDRHNDRKWFEDHRADYESLCLEPARQFVMAAARPLDRYRAAAVDANRGKALRRVISRIGDSANPYELPEPTLKRVPRGFDPDHPNVDLLRHKSLFAGARFDQPAELFDKRCVPYVIDRFKDLMPLQKWLCEALVV
jgi:uncharacterized protein (DUF2461 family)